VETLHFVESDDGKCWRDLGEVLLGSHSHFAGPASTTTRTNPAAPWCRV
jgi:hypothetical protein